MNNRTALILKLARKEDSDSAKNNLSRSTATAGVLHPNNEWKVVREDEVRTENNLFQHEVQSGKNIQSTENSSNLTVVEAMIHDLESNSRPSINHTSLMPSATLENDWTVVREEEIQTCLFQVESGKKTQSKTEFLNLITVEAMIHNSESNFAPSTCTQLVPTTKQNIQGRPKRNHKPKELCTTYTSLNDSYSENEDCYDSDKDPLYVPDEENNFKSQRKRKIDEAMGQIAARRNQNSNFKIQNVNAIDFDVIEDNKSDDSNDIVEYNIILETNKNSKENGKKRSLNKNDWSKIKSKTLRNSGQAYVSSSKTKKEIARKELKPPCKDKCRINCKSKINENDRQQIFNEYWELGDLNRQRDFIASHILAISPAYQYKKEGSNRKPNHSFYFEINDKRIRVCKEFFKSTLDINDRPIRTVISKKNSASGGFVSSDMRGKHDKHQTQEDKLINEGIRRHIELIPKIESHYLRANTTREFIEGGKSIADLHRDYVDDCNNLQQPSGSYKKYYDIFTKEYNISVFIPKKDQCELCHSYKTAEGDDKTKLENVYERHIMEKDLSRLRKESDKDSISDKVIVACYDLQAVLPCPKGEVSLMYYKSKLNLFNLSVCELKQDRVVCFTWHEGEGGRGSCEIATCIYNYMKQKTDNLKDDVDFIFYSDNCSGQQKNKYVFSMYLYAVENLAIKSITHNFLIKGHSQNEGDNVHSMIEKQVKKCLKSGPIYHPAQYVALMKTAKKTGNPYLVNELSHEDFIDFKDLWSNVGCNTTINEQGIPVTWNDIKVVRVEKNAPSIIRYKTTFDEKVQFEDLCIQRGVNETAKDGAGTSNKKTRNARKKSKKAFQKFSEVRLKNLYNDRLELSDNKRKDLKYLLDKSVIPSTYADFYNALIK